MWLLCTGKWEREKLKQIVICLEKKTASAPKQNWDESFLVPEIRSWEVFVPSNFLKTVESFRLVTEIHICGFSFHYLVSFKLDRSISLTQSYKHFTLVNYASRVVITSKLLIFATRCRFVIYERRGFIRLATGIFFISLHPLQWKTQRSQSALIFSQKCLRETHRLRTKICHC